MSKLREYAGHTAIPNFVRRARQLVQSAGSAELTAGRCEDTQGTRVMSFALAGSGPNGGQRRTVAIYREICPNGGECRGEDCSQYLGARQRALAEDIAGKKLPVALGQNGESYFFRNV